MSNARMCCAVVIECLFGPMGCNIFRFRIEQWQLQGVLKMIMTLFCIV